MAVSDIESTAEALAERLFASALETDDCDILPTSNLDALADAGLYGIFAPPTVGGLGVDFPTMCRVVETLATGCLTTTLVWMQHFGLLGSLLAAPEGLQSWLPEACSGDRRGGIAFGGLLPGPPVLTAHPVDGGWILNGFAPWVSGWERIDNLHVAARGPEDTVVNLAIDAREDDGAVVTPRALAAVNASSTVRIDFDSFRVSGDRLLGIAPFDPAGSTGSSLRLNGSLALGVARRCCDLLGSRALADELSDRRAALDAAGDDDMASERARTASFAMRAASALVVQTGSQAVAKDQHAQRLAREAIFLLVFGSRAAIKGELLAALT